VSGFVVLSTIHTSFTVTDLDRSVAFWQKVMGYALTRRTRGSGDMVSHLIGVVGADIELAILEGGGHVLELIQYNSPSDRRQSVPRPWDVGAAHVALNVDNIEAAVAAMTEHGWSVAGTIVLNPRSQSRVAYVRDWDGVTIELIESPAVRPQPRA
jgi:catechol 2,3-dioxygenase-like lactoylglutathione lyase family enzyme